MLIKFYNTVINAIIASDSRYAVQHRIQRIISHPQYSTTGGTLVNDVALLLTRTNIEWSRGVGPVCLPFRRA